MKNVKYKHLSSRMVGAVLVLLVAAPASAEGRYENRLRSYREELSQQMATCAGRQEGLAKFAEQSVKPATAELSREVSKAYQQCAMYLRTAHDDPEPDSMRDGESKVEYAQRLIEREAHIEELALLSNFERDQFEEATKLLKVCTDLLSELQACVEDENRLLGEARKARGQNEAAPGQPEPTPAN
jgi:hypothetical protein